MKIFFCKLIVFFVCSVQLAASDGHVLFLLQSGHLDKALEAYQAYFEKNGKHDLDLLQKFGILLLQQGFQTREPETQLMSLFGAGVSLNESALQILDDGLRSPHPQLQLVALHFLDKFQNDHADRIMSRGLASNFLEIRIKAALYLARRKIPQAEGQISALMSKVEAEHIIIFPEIYALLGSPEAIRNLRKLLSNSDEKVRIEAIHCAANYERDDLLPVIRTLATHHSPAQQEACAWALGQLKDRFSVKRLQQIAQRAVAPYTQLAALHSLVELVQDANAEKIIYSLAESGDLFAIHLLRNIPQSSMLLYKLSKNNNLQVRVNSAISLLDRKDPYCFDALEEIVVRDSRDLVFQRVYSPGEALLCYTAIPSAKQNMQVSSEQSDETIEIKFEILEKAFELPEEHFLQLAEKILEQHQYELIPFLIEKIQNLKSKQAIDLLKKQFQKAGAPLIRQYCNLALFRLKEPGPYRQIVKKWLIKNIDKDFIELPQNSFFTKKEEISPYQLSKQEASNLLIESFEALAQQQEDDSISLLLDAIKNGNIKNRYVLAGLLLRAAQ